MNLAKESSSTLHIFPKKELSKVRDHRQFFDNLANKWNITKIEEWNKAPLEEIIKNGGDFIRSRYNGSLLLGTKAFVLYIF
jgi:hypothetical protein